MGLVGRAVSRVAEFCVEAEGGEESGVSGDG